MPTLATMVGLLERSTRTVTPAAATSRGGTSSPNAIAACRRKRDLGSFWHDYYNAMKVYYDHLDNIDWVAYYKNHGYQINAGVGGGCGGQGNQRVMFAPVFVSPSMQWAVPNGCSTGACPSPVMGAPVGGPMAGPMMGGGYGPMPMAGMPGYGMPAPGYGAPGFGPAPGGAPGFAGGPGYGAPGAMPYGPGPVQPTALPGGN
ncbi:MAG: hypothetical protein U0744_13160 [Gemmataceae bacterium]